MKRLLFTILVLLSVISALPASAVASEPREPVLARGAALHGANGMTFDRHDRLHIASVAGREIVVMDPQTGAILDRLGPDRGVEGPDDLTFGPDGALYWTSVFTGVVGRRAPDGTVSTVAQLPPGVGAITFPDDGRLFVAVSVLGDALYEVDPNGANPPRLVADGRPRQRPRVVARRLAAPEGLAVGQSGAVYVSGDKANVRHPP